MKTGLLYILLFICIQTYGQSLNAIFLVNDQLINEEISSLYVVVGNKKKSFKLPINYYPGELVFGDEVWNSILSDSTNQVKITFYYNTFGRNGKHNVANFEFELKKIHFEQPYLLVHIYDFRKRKYKRWYSHLTKEEYLCEIRFPNSGLYIRR